MSNEQEIKALVLDLHAKLDKTETPTKLIRIWLPLILVIFQFLAGVWILSRYTYGVEHNIKELKADTKEIKKDQTVMIKYLEDSTSYDHSDFKMQYEMELNYMEYLKNKGTRGGAAVIATKKNKR